MDGLHVTREQRIAAGIASDAIEHGDPRPDFPGSVGRGRSLDSLTPSEQDELDLQKLGYKSVLARGWGSFDNFACTFSALYCIGGIRVLFYIALSAGGPAAMYVLRYPMRFQVARLLTCCEIVGVRGYLEVSSRSSLQRPWPRHVPPILRLDPSTTGPSVPGVAESWDVLSLS
jgi:hypothetical protein